MSLSMFMLLVSIQLSPVIISSSSNHCVVQIVASSEMLTNFQQQVVQVTTLPSRQLNIAF